MPRWLYIPSPNGYIVRHAFTATRVDSFNSLCGLYEKREGAYLDDEGRCLLCVAAMEEYDQD